MIAPVFSRDDPLARSQRLSAADFRQFIAANLTGFYPLSWVAVSTADNRVAAAVLADDPADDEGDEGNHAIGALVGALRKTYFETRGPDRSGLLHIHFVACAAEHRRRGLIEKLVQDCLDAARGRGFSRAIVETSGETSRRLFAQKLSFEEIAIETYADFGWHGDKPFASIVDHEGMVLLEKRF